MINFKDAPRFGGHKVIEANRDTFIVVSPFITAERYQRRRWSDCADDVCEYIQARIPGWNEGEDWQHPDFDQVKDQVVNKYYK